MSNSEEVLKLAKEFQTAKFLGRCAKKGSRNKKVICSVCGRNMETIEEETPPFYCFRCGDKLELGGFHEI